MLGSSCQDARLSLPLHNAYMVGSRRKFDVSFIQVPKEAGMEAPTRSVMWSVPSSSSSSMPIFLEISNPSMDNDNANLGKVFASVRVSVRARQSSHTVAPNLGGE